jgi:hypothetical protein
MAGFHILHQLRCCGEGVGVKTAQDAVAIRELADPEQGEPLVKLLRFGFARQEVRQARQDRPLGLAAEDMDDPGVGIVGLKRPPIE